MEGPSKISSPRAQRKSIVFRTGADMPTPPHPGAADAFPEAQRRSRTQSTIQPETIMELIKSHDDVPPGRTAEKREEIARRLSLAAQPPKSNASRRLSTVAFDRFARRTSLAPPLSGSALGTPLPDSELRGANEEERDVHSVNSNDDAAGGVVTLSSPRGSGGAPSGPRFMSVATRYRLAHTLLGGGASATDAAPHRSSMVTESGPNPASSSTGPGTEPRIRRVSPLSPTQLSRQQQEDSRGAGRPSPRKTSTGAAQPQQQHSTGKQVSNAAASNPPTTSKRSRRQQLLKQGVAVREQSDSDDDAVGDTPQRAQHLQQAREEGQLLLLKQLTARSLSNVAISTLSQKITGTVRGQRAQPLSVAHLRKKLAAGIVQQFLNSDKAPLNSSSAVVFSGASVIDATWIKKILEKPAEQGVGDVLADGDAAILSQVEWVLSVRQQLRQKHHQQQNAQKDSCSHDIGKGGAAEHCTTPARSAPHDKRITTINKEGPQRRPAHHHTKQLVPFAPLRNASLDNAGTPDDHASSPLAPLSPMSSSSPVEANASRRSLNEALLGFAFGAAAALSRPTEAANATPHASSSDSSACRSPQPRTSAVDQHMVESESDGDDSYASSVSDSYRERQEASRRKHMDDDEEDLPLDTLRPISKVIGAGTLTEAVAFHRGRYGNASSRVEPMEFVGASNSHTPRSFRLGHHRGRRSPRVSPVNLALKNFSLTRQQSHMGSSSNNDVAGSSSDAPQDVNSDGGGGDDIPNTQGGAESVVTKHDVDDLIANMMHDVPRATELRSVALHHTPLLAKQVARLTFGVFARMKLKFLQRIALRFCELDGAALLPLASWLAVDANGPAGLHSLDLADNNIGAKDLPILSAAICGTTSLVSLSLRNNPLFLYYEEAQQRINAEHRETLRLFYEARAKAQRSDENFAGSVAGSPRAHAMALSARSQRFGPAPVMESSQGASMRSSQGPKSGRNYGRPPLPPVNPETPPHQLVAAFMTSLNQLEHLDLGFTGLTDTSVVKICNFLHEPDCRLKFLNLDGANITVSVSALLLDTIKRHCRSILDVSVRYVYFCSGPQFLKKLCHTLRRRLWRVLRDTGELAARMISKRRKQEEEASKRLLAAHHEDSRETSAFCSPAEISNRSPVFPPSLPGRRGTAVMPTSTSPSVGTHNTSSASSALGAHVEVDDDEEDRVVTEWVSTVHVPLDRMYLRHRALERWCDAKLEHRAKVQEEQAKKQLLNERGTVSSMGNIAQLRSNLSLLHRQRRKSSSVTTPRWLGGAGGGTPRAFGAARSPSASTRSPAPSSNDQVLATTTSAFEAIDVVEEIDTELAEDATKKQRPLRPISLMCASSSSVNTAGVVNVTNNSCGGPTTPHSPTRRTASDVSSGRSSPRHSKSNATFSTPLETPTPRTCGTTTPRSAAAVAFVYPPPLAEFGASNPSSPPITPVASAAPAPHIVEGGGATGKPFSSSPRLPLARTASLKIPLPRERPRWERRAAADDVTRSKSNFSHGTDGRSKRCFDAGCYDSDSDISSVEPADDDADDHGTVDIITMDSVDDDMSMADDWGGWNLAGLRRGYGGYTTNDPSLVSRRRRKRRVW